MKTLADIAVHYLTMIEFSDEEDIDLGFSASQQELWPTFFSELTGEEKSALSAAAQRALDVMVPPADEYGYDPGQLVTDDQKAFMRALISGEAFEEYTD